MRSEYEQAKFYHRAEPVPRALTGILRLLIYRRQQAPNYSYAFRHSSRAHSTKRSIRSDGDSSVGRAPSAVLFVCEAQQ